jgi:hypothetical protein
MRPNNLLTTLLYALLVALIFIAVYKACQMQRAQQTKAADDAELLRAQQEMGYYPQDSSEYGSSYAGEADTVNSLAPTNADRTSRVQDGIEDEGATPTPAGQTAASPKADNTPTITVTRPAVTNTTAKSVPKINRNLRYSVVAGTFSKMDGARRRLEEVIKMGYTNAEIGKINNGAHAVVIVKRTNDLNEAIRLVDKLEDKGMDARVLKRE